MYLGSWAIDQLLTFPVNAYTYSTGAATDDDGSPTYRVYEDETAAAILTGTMAKLDNANTTGLYTEQVTLSAGNGFERGKSYTIYIETTVGTVVMTTVHTFQVGASVELAYLLAAAANKIADHVLRRNLATARASSDGDTVTGRSLLGASSKLANRFKRNTGTSKLEVYEEDDTTVFFYQSYTAATEDPLTEVNTD